MSFVEPLFLFGLLAAAIPLVIHLYNRRKAVQQPFPALELLRESDRKEARSIKVRQWLLMALRVLAVALLALALAKPYVLSSTTVGTGDRLPKSVVFVLDDTMSMEHADWWEGAKEAIRSRLDALKPWDEIALVTATKRDGPVETLENDRDRIREALEELEPTQQTASVPEALGAAADILSGSDLPNQRIYLVSDFARGGFPKSAARAEGISYPVRRVSVRDEDSGEEPPRNLAVTSVDYRQVGPPRDGRWEFSTTVRNFGEHSAQGVEIRLEIDGESVAGGLIDVPADGTKTHTIRHTAKGTGVRRGTIRLVDADEMSADDSRHFTFRMTSQVDVLLVNGAPNSVPHQDELFFAVRALSPGRSAEGELSPEVVTMNGFEERTLTDYDVVVLANVARLSGSEVDQVTSFVEQGGGLFIGVGNQIETDVYNQKLEGLLPKPLRHVKRLAETDDPDAPVKVTRIGSSQREHPVFRVFDLPGGTSLQSARVYKYMLLEPSPPQQSTVLLSYKDGAPALLERRVGEGRVFLFTTTLDRAWTDLPVRSAYLPLLRRSMLYLARRATSEGSKRHVVGEPVVLQVSGVVDEQGVVTGPGEERFVLEPREGELRFTPTRAGAYEVWNGTAASDGSEEGSQRLDGLAFSVNVTGEESDLQVLGEEAYEPWLGSGDEAGADERTSDAKKERRVNFWSALLFAVTIALLLETLVGTRRSVLKKLWRRATFRDDPEVDV